MLKKSKSIFVFFLISFIFMGNDLFTNQKLIFSELVNKENLAGSIVLEDINTENYLTTSEGISSHYGHKFHNRKTASGERFDMYGYTAAHRKLPFGTIVKVVNLKNNKAVLVRINDRGPFTRGRIIDISYRAAKFIGGIGIPKVTLHYFNEEKTIESLDSSYYLGYSIDNPFLIIKKTDVSVVDSASDFEEAMNIYYSIQNEANLDCYLFVEAGKTQRNPIYVIGSINPQAIVKYDFLKLKI